MRWQALLMTAALPLAHWLYHDWEYAPGWGKQWAQWCFEHLAYGLICLIPLVSLMGASGWPRTLGLGATLWMILENAECGACGYLSWRDGSANSMLATRLCVEKIGNEPFNMAASAALAFLIVKGIRKWSKKRPT